MLPLLWQASCARARERWRTMGLERYCFAGSVRNSSRSARSLSQASAQQIQNMRSLLGHRRDRSTVGVLVAGPLDVKVCAVLCAQ